MLHCWIVSTVDGEKEKHKASEEVRGTEQGQGSEMQRQPKKKGKLQRVLHIFTDHLCTLPDSLVPHTVMKPLAHFVSPTPSDQWTCIVDLSE